MESELFNELKGFLQQQLQLFRNIQEMQGTIMISLGCQNPDFPEIMAKFSQKNTLLEQIQQLSANGQGLIDQWMIEKENHKETPQYALVVALLEDLEKVVNSIKEYDEKMNAEFMRLAQASQKPGDEDPNNRLNAYRAMR